jgi:CDP-diacylglycerol---glycerol-3-phosphate 3-phosphatidyltransferase
MFRHVPNALTALRLVLAFVFFVLLSFYQYKGRGDPTLLNVAFVIYLIALITDFLDGYLARKWQVEGAFGRMVDPFVDKVLVLGSFIFFAGKNFIIAESAHVVVRTITGVAPGMVVILLCRELLVTTFRGFGEKSGRNFGAQFSGKVKMVLQSVTILVILIYVNYYEWLGRHDYIAPATVLRNLCIWATIIVTVLSGLTYLRQASAVLRST